MSGKSLEKVVAWFRSPANGALIDRLAQAGIACVEQQEDAPAGQAAAGAEGGGGGEGPPSPGPSSEAEAAELGGGAQAGAGGGGGGGEGGVLGAGVRRGALAGQVVLLTGAGGHA